MTKLDTLVDGASHLSEILSMDERERELIHATVMAGVDEKLRALLSNERDYALVGLVPFQVMLARTATNFAFHSFPKWAALYYHKKSCSVVLAGPGLSVSKGRPIHLGHSFAGNVRHTLSWAAMVAQMGPALREELCSQILTDIETCGSVTDEPTKQGRVLAGILRNRDAFEFVGFAPNCMYVKIEGEPEHLGNLWSHPWGMVAVAFWHKATKSLVIAGPGIRYNSVMLDEVPMNREKLADFVRGLTG